MHSAPLRAGAAEAVDTGDGEGPGRRGEERPQHAAG